MFVIIHCNSGEKLQFHWIVTIGPCVGGLLLNLYTYVVKRTDTDSSQDVWIFFVFAGIYFVPCMIALYKVAKLNTKWTDSVRKIDYAIVALEQPWIPKGRITPVHSWTEPDDDSETHTAELAAKSENKRPPIQTMEKAIVHTAFHKKDSTEIDLRKGDTVIILEKDSSGWWYGYVHPFEQNKGFFPQNFVDLLGDSDPSKRVTVSNNQVTINENDNSLPMDQRASMLNLFYANHMVRYMRDAKGVHAFGFTLNFDLLGTLATAVLAVLFFLLREYLNSLAPPSPSSNSTKPTNSTGNFTM